MAGPGGGAPRRSHTKSRKGCESCKRRHIRCDEGFPQCHNCTKHKVRCPYNDVNTAPDLAWTPEIEAAIANWRDTGIFPFPAMGVDPAPDPNQYKTEELRLIYHVSELYSKLAAADAVEFSVWAREIPKILRIGVTHPFVMHALLALSAAHMSHQTGDAAIGTTMLTQSGLAIAGFQEAMAVVSSPEHADAALAASTVLSWQVTVWREWLSHSGGSASIIDQIQNNKFSTQFEDIVNDNMNFPMMPPSPAPDRKARHADPADLEALAQAQGQLSRLESHLKQKKQSTKLVSQLLAFVKAVRKVPSYRSPDEQFERLRSLREWLMWMPVDNLEQSGVRPDLLVIIAYYYSIALLVERLFPEMANVYSASLFIKPINQIWSRLAYTNAHNREELASHLDLMAFPLATAHEFQSRMGCAVPTMTYMPSPALSCFDATPVTSVYGDNMMFYSTDSPPIYTADSSPIYTTDSSPIYTMDSPQMKQESPFLYDLIDTHIPFSVATPLVMPELEDYWYESPN